ncbi:hypothetical protein PoB_007618200 [Plakobranchus ocellatus]|uniref:Uncharacterized protein n=1 Tax=Plakobranchus ocellatus TaxID=259542 RepID=A0AAV4DZC9_9GAST|nr:hypothetical protein PoB_007618200 [Plakobranchus ocellatus]
MLTRLNRFRSSSSSSSSSSRSNNSRSSSNRSSTFSDPNDNGANSRRGRRRDDMVMLTWQQDLGSNTTVEKTAFIKSDAFVVILESRDRELGVFGFEASTTTYDFTTGTGVAVMKTRARGPCYLTDEGLTYREMVDGAAKLNVAVMKTRARGPCYLTDEGLTYREMVDGAAKLNGSLAPPVTQLTLDGTGQAMSGTELQTLFTTRPALRQACGRRSVVPTYEPGGKNLLISYDFRASF